MEAFLVVKHCTERWGLQRGSHHSDPFLVGLSKELEMQLYGSIHKNSVFVSCYMEEKHFYRKAWRLLFAKDWGLRGKQ